MTITETTTTCECGEPATHRHADGDTNYYFCNRHSGRCCEQIEPAEEQLELITEDGELNPDALPETESDKTDLEKFTADWFQDIQKIGDYLNQQANDREWCGEYDQIIEELNDSLFFVLPRRDIKRRIEFNGVGEAIITATMTLDFPNHFSESEKHDMAVTEIRRWYSGYSTDHVVNYETSDTQIIGISNVYVSEA